MKTRMQPIGNAWQKLPRIIRDLATDPQGAPMLDEEAAALLPWIVSMWAIYHSADGEDDYYAVRRWEIVSDGLRTTPEISVSCAASRS